MATFYVLPPREPLEQLVSDFVDQILPGRPVPNGLAEQLLEMILAASEHYIVHREDLPGTRNVAEDLALGFGAEPGDEVIEYGLAIGNGRARMRHWVIPSGSLSLNEK